MAHSSRRRIGVHESVRPSDFPSNRSTIERQQSPRHLPGPSVSSFQDARIGGNVRGRFYTAGRDLIVNDNDLVTMILLPHVASGATFDSAERYSAGRCHPRTRQSILDHVKKWIEGTNPTQRILWMYGSAGAGKSSLMQSICELLRDSDLEANSASFFFSRGHPDRGKGTKLFLTLAYQLALQIPSVRTEINNALYRDPTLPTKSMAIQLRYLIIEPLLRLPSNALLSATPILFIDGLDECGVDINGQGVDTQRQIITLISKSLVENNIPVRFMIASRPEYWIRDAFETSPLSDISLLLSLRDDIDADGGIRTYLTENFEQIRLNKSRIMRSVVLPWPPKRIVDRFVEEASGQYIYASTILKFIGDHPFKSPEEQLRIIITPGPHRATAYSDVDRLYATILSAYPGWETMKRVLGGLLIEVNLIVIRVILGVPQTEITLVLDALSSLIDIVPSAPLSEYDQLLIPIFGSSLEDEKISFCHLSFREFLLDEARSGSYYIDIRAIHMEVIAAFFCIIHRNLDKNYEVEPHVSCNMALSEYRRMMAASLRFLSFDSSYNFRDLLPVLNSTMERFRRFDPARRMNYPACFIRDMDFLSNSLSQMSHMIVDTRHNTSAVEQAALIDSFLDMANQLRNLAGMARKIGIHLLSFCDGFRITPTLFFIHHLTSTNLRRRGVQIWELLTNPGCTVDDFLSTIQQHRHIIEFLCDKLHLRWVTRVEPGSSVLLSLTHLGLPLHDPRLYWRSWTHHGSGVVLKTTLGGGWLCPTEWANQCVLLVCNCLKSIMNHLDNDWEHLDKFSAKHSTLADFFNKGAMSDIHGTHYFKNKYHLSFLDVMVDFKAWMNAFPSRPRLWINLAGVIVPGLCWFNRQLTNPKTCELIEENNASLLSKMTTAMNTIFQKCFVPNFVTPYFSELVISTDSNATEAFSIKLIVSTSSYSEEKIDYCPVEDHDADIIDHIHTEIFKEGPHPIVDQPLIPRSEWYPYLAAYLLNVCVKNIYCRSHSDFRGQRHDRHSEVLFYYDIVQCLPYAQTTPQNLDALRAIKYLSQPRWDVHSNSSSPRFYPPSGFCSAAREFLRKYEPSALSPRELADFDLWLRGIKEDSTLAYLHDGFDVGRSLIQRHEVEDGTLRRRRRVQSAGPQLRPSTQPQRVPQPPPSDTTPEMDRPWPPRPGKRPTPTL